MEIRLYDTKIKNCYDLTDFNITNYCAIKLTIEDIINWISNCNNSDELTAIIKAARNCKFIIENNDEIDDFRSRA